MALRGSLRALTHEGRRFLCFCEGGSDSPRLLLTNACEFWSCTIPLEKLTGQALSSPEDGLSKLRDILQGQAPSLTVQDSRATVQFQDGWLFELDKASLPEARRQLQDLIFGLVEQVETLEKLLQESVAASLPLQSPKKQLLPRQSPFEAGLSPPKRKGEAGPRKRRLPGESLINPGFRSKMTPTGVDFDDA